MVRVRQMSPIENEVYNKFPFLPIVQELTELLTLTERVETLVPITYILCFAIAYYGPNAEILGNVKLTLWHYKPVLDIGHFMTNLFVLFGFDFMSLVINGIILRTTCNINIFKVFQKLQSEFWLIMAVQQAYSLIEVRKFQCWTVGAIFTFGRSRMFGPENRSRSRRIKNCKTQCHKNFDQQSFKLNW